MQISKTIYGVATYGGYWGALVPFETALEESSLPGWPKLFGGALGGQRVVKQAVIRIA